MAADFRGELRVGGLAVKLLPVRVGDRELKIGVHLCLRDGGRWNVVRCNVRRRKQRNYVI